MKKILILLSLVLVGCGAADKNKNKAGEEGEEDEQEEIEQLLPQPVVIEYEVEELRTFNDSIWNQVDQLEVISDRESAKMELEAKQNPYPAYYRLILTDTVSKLSYLKPDRQEDDAYRNYAMPFTSGNTYKFPDQPGVFLDLSKEIPGGFIKIEDRPVEWSYAHRDSIIQGQRVRLQYGKQGRTEIRAWVTSDYPKGLGLFDMNFNNGFVLAFELKAQNQGDFESIYLRAHPVRIRTRKREKFKTPYFRKRVSEDELREFRESTKNKALEHDRKRYD